MTGQGWPLDNAGGRYPHYPLLRRRDSFPCFDLLLREDFGPKQVATALLMSVLTEHLRVAATA